MVDKVYLLLLFEVNRGPCPIETLRVVRVDGRVTVKSVVYLLFSQDANLPAVPKENLCCALEWLHISWVVSVI